VDVTLQTVLIVCAAIVVVGGVLFWLTRDME
jgi:hypothetical protein